VSVAVYLTVGLAVFQMEMWVTVSGVRALCGWGVCMGRGCGRPVYPREPRDRMNPWPSWTSSRIRHYVRLLAAL